ncbi:MAG: CoA-binding protein [Candidatus Krumholzibacteriia bacterium]
MSDQIPGAAFANPPDDRIADFLRTMRRVAVVGISDRPDRPSHGVARFLIGAGYEVFGVNPVLKEALGRPVFPTLAEVPGPLDLVDIFRRSEAVPEIVEAAIAAGARGIWMQEEVVHLEAAARARAAGLFVVMDRCVYKEWLRLLNG